jgi:hypothetical protein
VTEQQAVGVLTATDGPMAGSLATGSLRPCKKLRSGGAVARPCDMSAIWRLLGGGGGRIVVHCRRDCHRRGGGGDHTTAREGGGAYPERTKEREGENDNVVTNNNDGGNALLRRQRRRWNHRLAYRLISLDLLALCAMQYSITPSRWDHRGEPSSAAPLLSSVGRHQRRGEGPGLVGGDRDRGPRSGVHPAGREVQSSCGSSTWR